MRLLFVQYWLPEKILKALGWTLIHSLWQGLLAAVLAAIIIIATRKSVARLRYNLLGIVLLLFLMATVISFYRQLSNETPAGQIINNKAGDAQTSSISFNNGIETAPHTSFMRNFIDWLNANTDLLVLLWAIFFIIHCVKLFVGFAGIKRIRRYKTRKAGEEWQIKLNNLKRILGVQQSILLLQSALIRVPVAVGFLKPVILVPLGLLSLLPPDQVETILLHELAHIRRRDYLINLFQCFAEAIFFFNPGILWVSSLIRQEREACCDDIVVSHTRHKISYLEALVSFQEYSHTASGYVMAIGHDKYYLLNRVKRIITRENKKLSAMEKLLLLAGLIVIMAFSLIPKNKNTMVLFEQTEKPAELKLSASSLSLPVNTPRAIVNKKIKKKISPVPRIDTVPIPKKTNFDEMKFPYISTTINNDGNTITEITTATDQNGKKYMFTKLNNEVTSLSIDGNNVPQNEIVNYSSLFRMIEFANQENKMQRQRNIEAWKAEAKSREKDARIRGEENRMRIEDKVRQRKYELEKRNDDIRSRNKERDKERRIKEKERMKEIEMQRKEIEKNKSGIENGKRKKINTKVNGKEVIRDDRQIENIKSFDYQNTTGIKIEPTENSDIRKQKTIENKPISFLSDVSKMINSKIARQKFNALYAFKTKSNFDLKFQLSYELQKLTCPDDQRKPANGPKPPGPSPKKIQKEGPKITNELNVI